LAVESKPSIELGSQFWRDRQLVRGEAIPQRFNEFEALFWTQLAEIEGGDAHGANLYRSGGTGK
jgi:hypothetical protein